jgi:hypothetical protein
LRLAVPIAFATVASLAAGTWYVRHDTPPEAAHAPVAPAAAPRIVVTSHVPSLRIVATSELPRAAPDPELSDFCADEPIAPKTAAGAVAASHGWYVTGEQAIGPYVAVGIFSHADDGTSGACLVHDGSVAVFAGSRLVAIAWDPEPVDAGTYTNAGYLAATSFADRVRLWPGGPGTPVADLVLTRDGLELADFPVATPYCGGRVTVPRVWGRVLPELRAELAAAGWRAVALAKPSTVTDPESWWAKEVPELQDCSGTGFGFCGAEFRHANGATLSVSTIGEQYAVMDVGVACPP